MANQKSSAQSDSIDHNVTPDPAPSVSTDTLAEAMLTMAQAVQAMQVSAEAQRASIPTPKITFGDYKSKSPFNPRGRTFDRKYFQGGMPINPSRLHDADFDLLAQLKPGQFLNGLVKVQKKEVDGGADPEIHIFYSNGSNDQRNALYAEIPYVAKQHRDTRSRFTELLQRCVDEANDKEQVTA